MTILCALLFLSFRLVNVLAPAEELQSAANHLAEPVQVEDEQRDHRDDSKQEFRGEICETNFVSDRAEKLVCETDRQNDASHKKDRHHGEPIDEIQL